MGLLNDLFPKKVDEVARAVDRDFEPYIKKAAKEMGLQSENSNFGLKISQLREIFEVSEGVGRWGVGS